jgi:thiol-disulfide isomerase/thioredoxin
MRARPAAALAIASIAILAVAGCGHSAGTASKAGTCLGVASSPAARPSAPVGAGSAAPGSAGAPVGAASVGPGSVSAPGSGGGSASGGTPVAAGPGDARIPDLEIACFDGSGDVRLDNLGKPAVISLWASWCTPCRAELPQIAAYAATAGPGIAVIGVDTADTRTGGGSMISDDHLGYPMLFDPDKQLSDAVGRNVLPLTLFVAPGGVVRYVYIGAVTPIDQRKLTDLAARYLGVRPAG